MKKIRYWFEFIPVYLVVKLARLLPKPGIRVLASVLAFVLERIIGLRKQVVLRNLNRAFPGVEQKGRKEICRNCYKFYARIALEWFRTPEILQGGEVHSEGIKNVKKYLDRERGIIVVTGHLGYWELSGAWIAREFGSITVYADVVHNPHVQKLIKGQRKRLNINTVTGKWAMKELAREIREGRVVAFVADQSKGSNPAEVPFFNYQVKNTRMPAFIARVTGAPVVPLAAVREDGGTINMKFGEPLSASLETVTEEDEEKILNQYNQWLEKQIRTYPEQYFWFHRRWKDAEFIESD